MKEGVTFIERSESAIVHTHIGSRFDRSIEWGVREGMGTSTFKIPGYGGYFLLQSQESLGGSQHEVVEPNEPALNQAENLHAVYFPAA